MVRLFHIPPQATFPGMATFSLSPANFLDWQRDSTSFEAMAAYSFRQLTLTSGSAEALRVAVVGPDFFRVVRTQPALGRTFLPEEYDPARAKVLVVSDGFWRSHMGAASDAAGRTLTFDGDYVLPGLNQLFVGGADFSGNPLVKQDAHTLAVQSEYIGYGQIGSYEQTGGALPPRRIRG